MMVSSCLCNITVQLTATKVRRKRICAVLLDADTERDMYAAFNGAASGCATGLVLAWGGKLLLSRILCFCTFTSVAAAMLQRLTIHAAEDPKQKTVEQLLPTLQVVLDYCHCYSRVCIPQCIQHMSRLHSRLDVNKVLDQHRPPCNIKYASSSCHPAFSWGCSLHAHGSCWASDYARGIASFSHAVGGSMF